MAHGRGERPIAIAGGGTGGHVFPGLAVAAELRRRWPDRPLLWIGSRSGLEARVVPEAGLPLLALGLGGIAGKSPAARLSAVLRAGAGVARCVVRFLARRPSAVLGVGGYASGPAGLAAVLLGVPLVVHEQNAVPGGTNRFLSRFARWVAVSFPETAGALPGRSVVVTGNPVRAEFFAAPPLRPDASPGPRHLLVAGGSRGARSINKAMAAALPSLAAWGRPLSIVHQTGAADFEETRAAHAAAGLDSEVRPFLDDMPERMARADLVVSRSGASAVFELAASGRPSVLVPFPWAAGGHQAANARSLAAAGAAEVIEDAALTGEGLAAAITGLLSDPARLARMGASARGIARPLAASAIADLLERAVGGATADPAGTRGGGR